MIVKSPYVPDIALPTFEFANVDPSAPAPTPLTPRADEASSLSVSFVRTFPVASIAYICQSELVTNSAVELYSPVDQ